MVLQFSSQRTVQLPCVLPTGAALFAPTADQRYLLSEEEFLRTHFPIQMHMRSAGRERVFGEQELLRTLLSPVASTVGNRVFVLYGAAGSGKSELMHWLQTHIQREDQARGAVLMRVGRNELHALHIAAHFQQVYQVGSLASTTYERWEECRQKPRTLAKMLVLGALERLLSSDDQINALYYQLVDSVQTNLEHCFAAMAEPVNDLGHYIELFSREDLHTLLENSVIPVSIDYETLRFELLQGFRKQLLEDFHLPQQLKTVAQRVYQEKQVRPILLIDDLVQSINLFATDLLDYVITLEEGCWDVVVGITPKSLEATHRGKELLNRISFLDTIDDRVAKLWLSDDYGLSSSFLDESTCVQYARMYLKEYKRRNGAQCNEHCPAFARCQHLEPGRQEDVLAPFNEALLKRLFRSLPREKGKVRYFTLFLGSILNRIAQGEDILDILPEYIHSELAATHPDPLLVRAYELYGPLANEDKETRQDETGFYHFLDIAVPGDTAPVINSLYRMKTPGAVSQHVGSLEPVDQLDPGKEAIRTWLREEPVNKQLLRPMRRGLMKAMKDGYAVDVLTSLHNAKSTHVLRWTQTRQDTIPPLQCEGVDDFEGIRVPRSIGTIAYLLNDFADVIGWRERELRGEILEHSSFPSLVFKGMQYRREIIQRFEQIIHMTIEEFAFALFLATRFFENWPGDVPAAFRARLGVTSLGDGYPKLLQKYQPHLPHTHLLAIRRLFDDCFKLRENVYDGLRLEQMCEKISLVHAVAVLQTIHWSSIDDDFCLNERPIKYLLQDVQEAYAQLQALKKREVVKEVLHVACNAGLETEEVYCALRNVCCVQDGYMVEHAVSHFLATCQLPELHAALLLAHTVLQMRYEQSIQQVRLLFEEASDHEHVAGKNRKRRWKFTQEELDLLAGFTREGFGLSLQHVDSALLAKLEQDLPELHRQLELRLQRS